MRAALRDPLDPPRRVPCSCHHGSFHWHLESTLTSSGTPTCKAPPTAPPLAIYTRHDHQPGARRRRPYWPRRRTHGVSLHGSTLTAVVSVANPAMLRLVQNPPPPFLPPSRLLEPTETYCRARRARHTSFLLWIIEALGPPGAPAPDRVSERAPIRLTPVFNRVTRLQLCKDRRPSDSFEDPLT